MTQGQNAAGEPAKTYSAPARVNLIGEHTDYTGGLVMPMAIGFHTTAAIQPNTGSKAIFHSRNFDETVEIDIPTLERTPRNHWSDYPVGVFWSLIQEGLTFPGFTMDLDGDVPLGAGLSSSASIEVATAMALLGLANTTLPLEKIAVIARRAENDFVGAKSGIMDQFIVTGGVAGRAMLLDCRSLTYDLLPLPATSRIVICNSMVKHQVASSDEHAYGSRRDEVEAGQAILRRLRPGLESLRDATLADLEAAAPHMAPGILARCRHIVTENARVLAAREALLASDLTRFGAIMIDAHRSFRDDFAASCPEVDTLVEIATRQPGCFGARITGGGFGGCTVNLIEADAAEAFTSAVREAYKQSTGIEADCFVCEASDGALALAAKQHPEVPAQ